MGIAFGYADANDADRLADDPIHKLLLGRDPFTGAALASQPTLSRFENGQGRQALYAMGRELATRVIGRGVCPKTHATPHSLGRAARLSCRADVSQLLNRSSAAGMGTS